MINYDYRVLYSRFTSASSRDSIYPEVIEKIEMMGMEDQFSPSINRIESKFNNSKVVFKGLKAGSGTQTANLKGFKDFSTLVIEEAEEITDEEIFDKILLSIRGNKKGNPIPNIKIIILNPTSKEHFIYKKYYQNKGVPEGFNGIKDNVCYIHTTYLSCLEFVPPEILNYFDEMKSRNPKKYNHIVLGGWLDKSEGVVFTNWDVGKFNPDGLPTSFGQDYGFKIDPTTLVEIAIDKKNKYIYVKEHLYKTGLTTSEIGAINQKIAGRRLIVADSAEPRLISELKKYCNIKPAVKGQGSISGGVAIMQDHKIIVEPKSTNIVKELNNYIYVDKGSRMFVDAYNHNIDSIRYCVLYNNSKPKAKIRKSGLL